MAKIIKTYDYKDESGQLLYQVVRYEPKDFRQRRPDGEGCWIWNLDGVRRILYRLQELLQANATDWVFIVEGEKDVDRLYDEGLVATTCAMGAVKWDESYSEFMNDHKLVAVIPDNDDSGKRHAKRVAESLACVGVKARILELPGLSDKGDVSDWLNNGGTKEKLLELVQQTGRSAVKLNLKNMADVKAETVEWFWDNKIPDNAFTIISGDPGASKSFLTIFMAAHITTGRPWPDCPEIPVKKGSAIFFSDEDDPAKIIRPRLDAHGAGVSKVYILESVRVSEAKEFFDITRHLSGVEDALEHISDCRMVVLDPITAYLGQTNANSNAEVRSTLTPLAKLASKHRVTIIGINHHNKRQDLAYVYRGLGSTAFVAQARSVWGVVTDKDDNETKIFCPIKANYCVQPTGLKYRIIEGVVTFAPEPWRGHIDNIIENKGSTYRVDEVADWLQERLGTADVASAAIFEEGEKEGFNKDLLYRAKAKLEVKARKLGYGGQWFWRMPDAE